jgi:hypothetical protein
MERWLLRLFRMAIVTLNQSAADEWRPAQRATGASRAEGDKAVMPASTTLEDLYSQLSDIHSELMEINNKLDQTDYSDSLAGIHRMLSGIRQAVFIAFFLGLPVLLHPCSQGLDQLLAWFRLHH